MLARILEPEFTNDPDESRAYDDMDHARVNADFVTDLLASGLLEHRPEDDPAESLVILDLGTGTALIPIELCRRHPNCRVLASDVATSMLEIAKINVAISLCEHRIQLHHGDGKQLEFFDNLFDGVTSNSWLHHLPNPGQGLAEMLRVCKPGGWLFTRDLFRPETAEQVDRLVAQHAADEPAGSQQLLRQSLHAALTLAEARDLVVAVGLPAEVVQLTSDRHWTLCARKPLDS